MSDDKSEHEESQAALRTLRSVLDKRASPGTLAPRHRIIEQEAEELAKAIEALADERDRVVEELKFAQAHTSPKFAISS
jgi:hypothetical protein